MKVPKLGIIVFARMSSSRLPGKMLRRLGDKSLLERVIGRAALLEVPLVLATSRRADDDVLARDAETLGIPVFRGSLDDVMGRAVEAAREHGFDVFARLCGDRPLFPLDDMRRGLNLIADSMTRGENIDLVTTHAPQPVPAGLTTEIIRTEALAQARSQTDHPRDLEHVTTCFYDHPERFDTVHLRTGMRQFAGLHFSVDREEDAELIGAVFSEKPEIDLSIETAAALLARLTKGCRHPDA